jgi:cytidylate kinase
MNTHAIRLITVSREFGAGGSELASALGARLGWPVVDHDLVHRVAERLRLDEGTVEHLDEHPPSVLARIASVLIIPQPDLLGVAPLSDFPSPDAIAKASHEVIAEMAKSPPLIVVGHGAQCIFADRDDTLHVRVIASVRDRLARVARRLRVDPALAGTLLRRADADRQAYVQRYFRRDLRDDLLYDLRINTGRLSIEESVAIVAGVVAGRASAATLDPALQPSR